MTASHTTTDDARIPDHCGWAARGYWREAYDDAVAALRQVTAERDAWKEGAGAHHVASMQQAQRADRAEVAKKTEVATLRAELDAWKAQCQAVERESAKCFSAQEEIDAAWDAFGTSGNRKTLSLAEQIASHQREVDDARAELDAARGRVKRATFPILGSKGATVDLQMVADHGRQAYTNHGQTVTRLAERGGLSWSELHAVLHNRRWQKMDETEATIACRGIEARYLAALEPDRAVVRMREALEELADEALGAEIPGGFMDGMVDWRAKYEAVIQRIRAALKEE